MNRSLAVILVVLLHAFSAHAADPLVGMERFDGSLLESGDNTWVQRELDVAMNQEIQGKRVKVLPILLKDCDLPGFLVGKFYADFRDPEIYERSLSLLLRKLGREDYAKLGDGASACARSTTARSSARTSRTSSRRSPLC